MRFLLLAILIVVAQPSAATQVEEVATYTALRAYTGSATNVSVDGRASNNDGGGGQFVQNGTITGGQCGLGSDDGGVIIVRTVAPGRCWYRQFSGPVHLSWYGVQDVADPGNTTCFTYSMPSSCDAVPAIKAALAAAAVYGDGGVTTDGRSIALLSQCVGCATVDGLLPQAVEIPQGQYLNCATPPGVRHNWHIGNPDAYWEMPGSLVLNPSYTVLRDENTLLSNCFIRPSWLYPQTSSALTLPPTNVLQAVQMSQTFKGTATSCASPTCNMSNVTMAGFDICDNSSGANNTILSNIVEDCLTGEWMHAGGGGGPKLHGVSADPILAGSLESDYQELSWPIVNVLKSGTDGVIVQVNTGSSGTTTQLQPNGDTVLISGLGLSTPVGSPVSANGRWLTSSVSYTGTAGLYNVALIGASWAGPTATEAAWKAGAPVITVHDNTNVIPGQYVCASGTPPLCTAPAGFAFSNSQLTAGISASNNIPAYVGSTAHWPVLGLALIGSTEYVSYTVKNATQILITARGQRGSTAGTHNYLDAVAPAAPVVLSVPPPVVAAGPAVPGTVSEAVIVSAPAQVDGSSAVSFTNDTMLWPSPGGATSYGTLYLNPSYHTWTANIGAGGRPTSLVTDKANGATGATSITGFKDCWKAQPGMLVSDISNPTYVQDKTLAKSCSGTTLTIDKALPATFTTFTGDLIQLSGCGYPGLAPSTGTVQPWLGNCAATGLLLGGTGAEIIPGDANVGDEIQGTMCDTIHSAGVELSIHSLNGKATTCANFIIDDAGPDGELSDPDSAGLWLDGSMAKSVYSNGRLSGGANAILVTPSAQQDTGDISISNTDVAGNIAVGTSASATLTGAHGQSPPFPATLFASSGTTLAQIIGANLLPWTVVSDDGAGYTTLACSGNVFATALCGQVRTVPVCISGCTSIGGTDAAFNIVPTIPGGTTTSVTITLAGQYATAPICTVSPGGGTAASAAVAIAYAPYGTTVTIQTSPAVPQLYGSCRAVTG